MPHCVQPEDKRRHRELDCLIPNDPPLPISGGNHTDRIDGRPNWLCLPVAAPGQIHNWATRRSNLGPAVPIAPGDHLNTTRSLTRFQIFLNFCVENAKNCLSPPPKSNSSFLLIVAVRLPIRNKALRHRQCREPSPSSNGSVATGASALF